MKIKMTRNCVVDREGRKVGDVVTVDEATRNLLCGINKAVDYVELVLKENKKGKK